MISIMDNDTIIMVYGDHGMNNEGHHGGSSIEETSTILFGYCKGGLPMKNTSEQVRKVFDKI
jgi:hypothetical protein